MTVGEFILQIQEWRESGYDVDAMTLSVHAFGGMRQSKAIEKATIGFDWDAGKIVLHSIHTLQIMPPRAKK